MHEANGQWQIWNKVSFLVFHLFDNNDSQAREQSQDRWMFFIITYAQAYTFSSYIIEFPRLWKWYHFNFYSNECLICQRFQKLINSSGSLWVEFAAKRTFNPCVIIYTLIIVQFCIQIRNFLPNLRSNSVWIECKLRELLIFCALKHLSILGEKES